MATLSVPIHRVVISPSAGGLRVNWRELWEYRDLLVILVQRDFIARYKQTALGPLWYILQPVLTMAVFAIVFGGIAGIPTGEIPAPLFYLCGLLGWNYFAQNIVAGSSTFISNSHIFTKVWFPRLIVPVATILSNLFAFGLQLVPFLLFLCYYKFFTARADAVQITWLALLTPLPILHTALLSLGVALWMAASTAKYRDMVHLNQYLVQLWMFATPIIYPLSKVPAHWKWLVWVNPVSVPVETFRLCLLGRGTVEPLDVALSVGMTLALLFTGIVAFQNATRTAADIV